MRYFDKKSLIGLTADAKRANMDINDYVEMITSNTERSRYRVKWLDDHKKFTDFCLTIKDDIIDKIDSDKIAIIDIDNIIDIIEENHISIKSLGIYDRKELMIGLYFYFCSIDIDVCGGRYDGYIQFKYIDHK